MWLNLHIVSLFATDRKWPMTSFPAMMWRRVNFELAKVRINNSRYASATTVRPLRPNFRGQRFNNWSIIGTSHNASLQSTFPKSLKQLSRHCNDVICSKLTSVTPKRRRGCSDRRLRCKGPLSTSAACDAQQRRQWLACPFLDVVASWFMRPSSATTTIYCSM